MNPQYASWLANNCSPRTVNAQLYRADRVEKLYGDLDKLFDYDGLQGLVKKLNYTVDDERQRNANPTRIPIKGDLRSNIAAYRASIMKYCHFRQQSALSPGEPAQAWTRQTSSTTETHLPKWGDGLTVLEEIIASSCYKTVAQAVASLALFSHRDTVQQTGNRSIFRTIRGAANGADICMKGKTVMPDDNRSPTEAFMWVHGWTTRPKDIQINHVYSASKDVEAYTCLANICITPDFIAKLTDGSKRETGRLLRYHVYKLYDGWRPSGFEIPEKPENYDRLKWADTLPAVHDVRAALVKSMQRKKKNRTMLSTRRLGWLFGDSANQ